jgi:hypothetical protein
MYEYSFLLWDHKGRRCVEMDLEENTFNMKEKKDLKSSYKGSTN